MDFAKVLLVGAAMVSLGAALAHARVATKADSEARSALGALRVLSPMMSKSLGGSGISSSCDGGGGEIASPAVSSLNSSSTHNMRDLGALVTQMKPDYLAVRCDEVKRAYSDDLALVRQLEGGSGVNLREISPALIDSTRQSLNALKVDVQANRIPASLRQKLTVRYPFLAFYVDGSPVDVIPGMAAFKADIMRQIDEGIGKVDHLGSELGDLNADILFPEPLKQTKVRCTPRCPSTMGCTANFGGFWVPLPE